MKNIIKITAILGIFISVNCFADTYQRCSGELQNRLIQQFKLDQNTFSNQVETYKSCLNLDVAQTIQLLAISQPIKYLADDDASYNLNLYLIDSAQNKILQKYTSPDNLVSDADHFDGIQLDSHRFSTLPNTDVIALTSNHSHRGGFTYYYNNLSLFKFSSQQPIRKIFDGIGTNEGGYEAIGNCAPDNARSDVKRILILSNKTNHGLQDIIMKETKNQTKTNYRTCKAVKKQFKQQQTIQFNGKEYKLQHQKLLGVDPF